MFYPFFKRFLILDSFQTYGVQYKQKIEGELITYVDRVDIDGPAFRAGLMEGDVILSINGREVDKADHTTLVRLIKSRDKSIRMVVRFENCVHKVNVHTKYLKMKVSRPFILNFDDESS